MRLWQDLRIPPANLGGERLAWWHQTFVKVQGSWYLSAKHFLGLETKLITLARQEAGRGGRCGCDKRVENGLKGSIRFQEPHMEEEEVSMSVVQDVKTLCGFNKMAPKTSFYFITALWQISRKRLLHCSLSCHGTFNLCECIQPFQKKFL